MFWKCCRCNHEWPSRKPEPPRRCAKCTALYWDRPARIPKEHKPPGVIGRAPRYPQLVALEIGQRVMIPWASTPTKQPDFIENAKYLPAANYQAKRNGWEIRTEASPAGLIIIRLS